MIKYLFTLVTVALLAGCGRYGDIKPPPGSIPRAYPTPPNPEGRASGVAPPSTSKADFTKDGSYIDPSTARPVIYPTATTQSLPTSPYNSGMGIPADTAASGSTYSGLAP